MLFRSEEFRTGSIMYVDSDYNFLAYGRIKKEGKCLILINNNNHLIHRAISVWMLGTEKKGKMKTLLYTDEGGYAMEGKEFEIISGKIRVELPRTCAMVLKYIPNP